MEISNLTFVVTDDCNLNCTYCVQKKEKKTISKTCIKQAVDFFYPFFKPKEKIHLGFYGGEPLLAYEQVKHAVHLINEKNKKGNKKIEFSLTTNGLLLTDEKLDFFNRNRFALTLSFDGLAQEKGRKKGTLGKMVRVTKQVRDFPDIHFEINSVFTPRTIAMFSGSLRFMIEPGGPEINFNISNTDEWDAPALATLKKELDRLVEFLVLYYKKTGKIPVKNFQGPAMKIEPTEHTENTENLQGPVPKSAESDDRVFRCGAGSEHMAVTPGGDVWGCFLFHDYFKAVGGSINRQYQDFSFGVLGEFTGDYERRYAEVSENYAGFRQDFYKVEGERFCFLCPDVGSCMVCPVNAAYSSGALGKISCRQCQLNKIQQNARALFEKTAPMLGVPIARP